MFHFAIAHKMFFWGISKYFKICRAKFSQTRTSIWARFFMHKKITSIDTLIFKL